MAIFHIYADASGKLAKDDYTSFCGYVAHISEWSIIQQEWDNCRFRWQVPPIHMSKIMVPERDERWLKIKTDWGKEWEDKRDAMLLDFAATIRTARIVFVGATVDAAYFRKLADTDAVFKKIHRDTLYLAFHTLVMRGIEATEIVDKHSPISLVIDDDQQYSISCYQMVESLKRDFPKVKERIHGIAFVNDQSFPGVQAADMIAYEARNLDSKDG